MVNGSSFNYTFDYSDYDTKALIPAVPATSKVELVLKYCIGMSTVISIAFLVATVTKSNVSMGVKAYCINLMIVNLGAMLGTFFNDKALDFGENAFISSNFINGFKENATLLRRLANMIYSSTTFILIYETTQKYRRNLSGFPARTWFILLYICDLIPVFGLIAQSQWKAFAVLRPNILACYQGIWAFITTKAAIMFITASVCCFQRRKKEEEYRTEKSKCLFGRWHLIRLSLFLITTLWLQMPSTGDYISQIFTVKMDTSKGMDLLPKVQPYIKYILQLRMWTMFLMPLVETVASTMFLLSNKRPQKPALEQMPKQHHEHTL